MELASENRIAEIRAKRGLKQIDLANKLGVSRGQLANLESGTRKINLEELRRIAQALSCAVVELLMPEDAPNQPDDHEASLLHEFRAMEGYDPRAVLVATRAVIDAARAVRGVQGLPKGLGGDPLIAKELLHRWEDMDDRGRERTIQLLDTARAFSR